MTSTSHRVVALAYDGLALFEFAVAAELFGLDRPELNVHWYDFQVAAVEPGPLRSLGGITVATDGHLDLLETADTVIIPGWRNRHEPPPEKLVDALRSAHDAGARLVSICSGVFLLAATGLLDGKAATTHWNYVADLQQMYPAVNVHSDVLYVDNGSVLTSAGSAAGIDLGLHLIRSDYGPEIANEVARRMVVPPHRDGGQAQYIPQPVAYVDDMSVSQTLDWALEKLATPITAKSLSAHAQMSERTFSRRFTDATGTTPHRWLTLNRIRLARDLLEATDQSIERVAEQSGLGSAANLRHHFRREMQTTPTDYRRTFAST